MSGATKCGRDGTLVRFCVPMDARLDDEANARRKGLIEVQVTNTRTGKTRTVGVAYRTGPKDRGAMLECCPWCGAPILWTEQSEAPKGKDTAQCGSRWGDGAAPFVCALPVEHRGQCSDKDEIAEWSRRAEGA